MPIPTKQVVRLGEEEFCFEPITIRQLMEIENYLKTEHMTETNKQIAGFPLQVQVELAKDARKEANLLKTGTKEFNEALATPKGIAYTVYLSLRSMKGITLNHATELVAKYTEEISKILPSVLGAEDVPLDTAK